MITYGMNGNIDNLKLCFDAQNPKSWDGTNYYDLVTGNNWNNIGNPPWFNNIGNMTISLVIEWYQMAYGYADHPISKFNATLQNASMTFYMFQNYQGNGADGQWAFIAGNGTWTGLGSSGQLTFGAKHHIVLQYGAQYGAQTWFNGQKNGGLGANGVLGSTYTAGTDPVNFEGSCPTGNGHDKMHHLSIWNRTLSDNEIVFQYNMLKNRYGVV
jgi:hypothetical protein